MNKLIEAVPNFSEGQDKAVINAIANAIRSVNGVKLLHIDIGFDANRTVMTFVGEPNAMLEAGFLAIKTAAETIDMTQQKGEHPRIGATDVFPFIPIQGVSMEECVELSYKLAEKVSVELNIPIYCYENSAKMPQRKNLAVIRKGEYEGLAEKILLPDWKPDFGEKFNPKTGATVMGARQFLIAYNINLNTKNEQIAQQIAEKVREKGKVYLNDKGDKITEKGLLKNVKAIGWYMETFGKAQISMNLTDFNVNGMHQAFEACQKFAEEMGVKVTGSELIGMLPKTAILQSGLYFAKKQGLKIKKEEKLIDLAVKTLGLDELSPFIVEERVIEYRLLH